MDAFRDYAYYYNAFYQDKNYEDEAKQIDKLIKQYGHNVHEIINYGCGTGRHDIAFFKMGYQCMGIDMSPLMIEIANDNAVKEGVDINFKVADLRSFVPEEKYDAVISLFHVMSYQNENRDIVSAFTSARKALNQGGLFLFDVWYGPGVLSDKPTVRVKKVEDKDRVLIRIAKPDMYDKENLVVVSYEILIVDKGTNKTKIINEVHNMRYFFKPEIEYILEETGFELIDNLDCNSLKETGYNSWTSYFIAKAV